MDFKLSNSQSESTLISTNRNLKNRWCVLTPYKLQKDIGGNWLWFNLVVERKNNKRERTRLYLGYDDVVYRPVMVKVVKYDLNDVTTAQGVIEKRKVLSAQIDLLNDILSPLLPEPLDWFNIENSVEGLPTDDLCKTEPVLILDYQPGVTLEYQISKKIYRRFEKENNSKNTETDDINEINLDVERIARLVDYIRYFFEQIYDKGYMYVGLGLDEVLLLKDDVPRFVGLGKICKVKDGKLDNTHINFRRTSIGYSAPEFKPLDKHYVERPDAKAVAAFNLGVIFAQMMAEKTTFELDILENGYFKYPNPEYEKRIIAPKNQYKGRLVHDLITRLCDPNPNTRLTDFKEIESKLDEIKGNKPRQVIEPIRPKPPKIETEKDILGMVTYYDEKEGFGYIREFFKNPYGEHKSYRITKKHLENGGLLRVRKNDRIKFDRQIKTTYDDNGQATKVDYVVSVKPSDSGGKGPGGKGPGEKGPGGKGPGEKVERTENNNRSLWDKITGAVDKALDYTINLLDK